MEKNFSATIVELLMHKDFQKHIKAIQMLSAVSGCFSMIVNSLPVENNYCLLLNF